MPHPGRLATAFAQQASREGASKLTVPAFADTVDAPENEAPPSTLPRRWVPRRRACPRWLRFVTKVPHWTAGSSRYSAPM